MASGLQGFSFLTAGEIRFGRGKASGAAGYLAARASRVLVVHGGSAARAQWLLDALRVDGVEAAGFACPREPDVTLIAAGVALARELGAGAVVALGGGSAIDAGKAIAAMVPATRSLFDHLEVVGRGLPLDAAPLPFVALPTTAGTGAEVTRNAVIGVPEARRKVSLRDNRMLATLAIVDPALTDGCPRGVTLASGFDAITQVIEPYVSTRANAMCDALCRDAIPRGLAALATLMAREDAGARDEMAYVGLVGGIALTNAGLGAVHGLAGPAGGLSGAPHGAVCGALLPGVLAENIAAATGNAAERLAEVTAMIGAALGVPAARAPAALASWTAEMGLPTLSELGVAQADLAAIAAAARASSSMAGNPVVLDAAALERVLAAAW